MDVRRTKHGFTVLAPAKLNLFLEVLARRPDGFHEIETLICAVSMGDTLTVAVIPNGEIRLQCHWATGYTSRSSGTEWGDVPDSPANLAWKALALLRDRAGIGGGAAIQLHKRIPSLSGLGGASADAAAALVAANQAWGLNWSTDRLAGVAAELGSDVPFFLDGRAAVCRGRGERIEPTRLPAGLHFVLVRPPVGLSTPAVYRQCRVPAKPQTLMPLLAALQAGRLAEAGRLFSNRLQEAAESLSPWIARLRSAFAGMDVLGHQMSGSGSSYFGLCRNARQAQRVASQLRGRGLGNVFLATSI